MTPAATTTTSPASEAVAVLRASVQACPASDERARVLALIDAAPQGIDGPTTLRAFMQAHHGGALETLQVDASPVWGGRPWAPGPRMVDASRASFVQLDGSRRDYRQTRVIASSADGRTMLAQDTGCAAVLLYVVAERGEVSR